MFHQTKLAIHTGRSLQDCLVTLFQNIRFSSFLSPTSWKGTELSPPPSVTPCTQTTRRTPTALQEWAGWHRTRCADSSCSGWLMWEALAKRSWPGPKNHRERTDFRQAVSQFAFCYFCQLSATAFSGAEQTRQTSILEHTEYTGQGFRSIIFNLLCISLPFHIHPPNLHLNKAFKLVANLKKKNPAT